jgi:predicted esterase
MKRPLFAVALLTSLFVLPLVPMHPSPDAFAAPKSKKPERNGASFTLASRFPGGEGAMNKAAWKTLVPAAREITLPSTADSAPQQAMWLDSGSAVEKPLLVVLHSWSTDYRQNIGIPYALFAAKNDWVFIHPNFRGPNQKPAAGASDLVTSDIMDAVAHAKRHARVDSRRIYLAGFSGGGLTALAMAGRRPDIWAGVVAWCPIHDIVDWYRENLERVPRRHYVGNIEAVCGGAPRKGSPAEIECRKRSPSAVLERAKQAGVPIYIGAGIRDSIVRPRHAIAAFNQLVDAADHVTADFLAQLSPVRSMARKPVGAFDPFTQAGAPARLVRTSGNTTLVLFDGGHDVVYDAGLSWLSSQRRSHQDSR